MFAILSAGELRLTLTVGQYQRIDPHHPSVQMDTTGLEKSRQWNDGVILSTSAAMKNFRPKVIFGQNPNGAKAAGSPRVVCKVSVAP
jgi:hypothetical protein